jgi:hypothetical protein
MLSSFIHTASYMASVICYYKTSNDNRFYHGSASDISGKGSIRLDEELSAVEMMAASKMAAIQLSVQGVAAGGMSAWLAGQAVLPVRGAAKQVRYSANLVFLAVVNRMAVANWMTASVVREAKVGRLLMAEARALSTE